MLGYKYKFFKVHFHKYFHDKLKYVNDKFRVKDKEYSINIKNKSCYEKFKVDLL